MSSGYLGPRGSPTCQVCRDGTVGPTQHMKAPGPGAQRRHGTRIAPRDAGGLDTSGTGDKDSSWQRGYPAPHP